MANRLPLTVDSTNRSIKELPAADHLELGGSNVYNAGNITCNTTISATTSITSANLYSGGPLTATGALSVSGTSTLTGDALLSGNIDVAGNLSATYYEAGFSNVLISSGAVTYDLRSASVFRTDLSNDIVTVTITNPPVANTVGTFLVQIVGTGQSNTITWPASIKYKDNTAPTLGTGSGNVNTFAFYTVDGGTTYIGSAIVGQYS